MTKTLKSIMCIVLCLVMAFSCTSAVYAESDWHSYWNENSRDISKGIYIAPGQTESERTIRWYTDSADDNYVALSENDDMAEAKEYTASVTETPQGDYSAEAYINNLEEGKTYYYTCNSENYTSSVYSFSTTEGNNFSALYVTDVHISYGEDGDNTDRDE